MPRSLAGRLLLAAAATIAVALLVSGIAIAFALERFVVRQIDGRLDAQLVLLANASAGGPQGIEAMRRDLDRPPFDRRGGWLWVVEIGDARLVSHSLEAREPPPIPDAEGPKEGRRGGGPPDRIRSADAEAPRGREWHWRILRAEDGTLLAAAAPRDPAITRPLGEAMMPLGIALAVLGAALAGAAVLQVRLGLHPLRRMRGELAAIRSGARDAVSEKQPSEIQPLAIELNSLLRDNAAGLARARRHAANLAHGLKTPLATLAAGASIRSDPAAQALVEGMDRMIRHHLARARAAALGDNPARARTDAAPRLDDLLGVMRAMHAARGIAAVREGSGIAVACEAQDFDEMFGNLLDNAFKWAAARVRVSVESQGRYAVIAVEDDGPGIAPDAMPEALRPGRRIDEATPGFGFGLPIAKELVELYGGNLELGRSEALGGLRAVVRLPQA